MKATKGVILINTYLSAYNQFDTILTFTMFHQLFSFYSCINITFSLFKYTSSLVLYNHATAIL